MDRMRSNARQAGLLYLALALIAPFSLSFVPEQLADAGGISAATVAANAPLLRLSLASELVYQVIEIFIALALFDLFRRFDHRLALRMLVLGLLPIPIIFLNQLSAHGAIQLATGVAPAASMAPDMRDAVVAFLYDLHRTGILIAAIFWGLWLFPLGQLIITSRSMHRLLGWSVIVGGCGYLLRSISMLALPGTMADETLRLTGRIADLMVLGELPVIAGLLWLGFRRSPTLEHRP